MTKKRPAWLDRVLDVLNTVPEGHTFRQYELADMLVQQGICRNTSTASVYGSFAIRHLMDVQHECPEAPQLVKAGRYYLFTAPLTYNEAYHCRAPNQHG